MTIGKELGEMCVVFSFYENRLLEFFIPSIELFNNQSKIFFCLHNFRSAIIYFGIRFKLNEYRG